MSFSWRRVSIRGGFTLMELLVVIAIIALLVSILMPSLEAAKSLARMAVCKATLHTMALANSQYMGDYDGFSVHGEELWWSYDYRLDPNTGKSENDTGYGLPLFPTDLFDDDYAASKKGQPVSTSFKFDRNQMNNGGQNICSVGQLMYDKYLEESAGAISCPQADFDLITATTLSDNLKPASYQEVIKYMARPRIDPKTPGGLDPNDYWRNDYFDVGVSDPNRLRNIEARSCYGVRGPMFRPGDVVYLSTPSRSPNYFPTDARAKPDMEIALFADFERMNRMPYYLAKPPYQENLAANLPDPPCPGGLKAWQYWPRRHKPGVNVAYVDGHVALFPDESRRKTWLKYNGWGTKSGALGGGTNESSAYGNSWAIFAHVYDAHE